MDLVLFISSFRFPAEFLFLLWGVYLCYAVRTVPSAFHEPRYMAVAIYNELLISAIFHIIRWVKQTNIQRPAVRREWLHFVLPHMLAETKIII